MLIGRVDEVRRARVLLDAARRGRPGALVLVGDAGIGCSALLDEVAALAGDVLTLRLSGVEVERPMELAGYTGLFGRTAGVARTLDPDSARVLLGLLRHGRAPAPLELGMATLRLLGRLAEERPVLLLIDDAQWVDAGSLAVLEFVLRRLTDERVALLAARRSSGPDVVLGTLPTFEMPGLEPEDVGLLLEAVGVPVTPEVAVACHRRTGGNPLAVRSLGGALTGDQRRGLRPLPELLPAEPRLLAAAEGRLAGLSADTRSALRCVGLAGRLHLGLLVAALDRLGLCLADLADAEAAGIVRIGAEEILFGDPLIREAAIRGTGAESRRAHRAIAEVTTGARRAQHLARAYDGDGTEAVVALVEVAEEAAARGAHPVAAEAWREAAELAADPAMAARYRLAAGVAWASAAVPGRAARMIGAALEEGLDRSDRARAAAVLGDMLVWSVSVGDGVRVLCDEGETAARHDPAAAALLIADAAVFESLGGDARAASDLARRAVRLAADADEVTRYFTRTIATHVLVVQGGDPVAAALRHAEADAIRDLVAPGAGSDVLNLAQLVAFDDMTLERPEPALDLFERIADAAAVGAEVGIFNFARAMGAEVLWRRGRWSEARARAMDDVIHHDAADREKGAFGHAAVARIDAVLGFEHDALTRAAVAVQRGTATGMGSLTAWGRHAEGLAALAAGRPADAVPSLMWVWEFSRRGGLCAPGLLWWHADLLDALIDTGEVAEARRLVGWVDERAQGPGSRWAAAAVGRGLARLDGDVAAGLRSVELLDELGAVFEAARSRLVVGSLLGGPDRVRLIEQAADTFAALGTLRWQSEARRLLSDNRPTPPTAPSPAMTLSGAELRVAVAVGRGATNREAAAELALSPKTVDAHLRSIYRKLGVRSRTELALRLTESGA